MLETPLKEVLHTTKFHLSRLSELGVKTVADFLQYFPRGYTDQRSVTKISELIMDTPGIIRGKISTMHTTQSWHRRMRVTTALISDESGTIETVWFNQTFLSQKLKALDEVIVAGKATFDKKNQRVQMKSPQIELVQKEQVHTARIVPLYHQTELNTTARVRGKISSQWIREKLFPLMHFSELFPEFMPQEICDNLKLMPLGEAIRSAHFPASEKNLEEAKRRLAFNELFLLQLGALYRKNKWKTQSLLKNISIKADWELIKKFIGQLPFALTAGQKKALYEILTDLEKPHPMSRLLEGDTGSGKTVVAAGACLQVIKAGFQVCLMAPTEILAQQHMRTFQKVLTLFGVIPQLLTGSLTEKEKKATREGLAEGLIPLVIGTHALVAQGIVFKNLGLAIIDEQHRFGVRQRELFKSYGTPHLLHLSATPIPRTLALVLYGDQDLSVLDEMPPNRQKIVTRIVPESKRKDAYDWIKKEIEKGRQAFIIFPLIEDSEILQIKAAVSEFERLQKSIFPTLTLGLLHGQLPAAEKEEVMKKFAANQVQILVSTAVVEVGVDVPNATIMMIEAAERFGLSQLHQFRGRVGRGSEQSYCLLFPSSQNPQALKRLNALVKYDSGFKLAEIDLQLRGPGEVFGTAQSGLPDLKMASLSDATTIKVAREAAEAVMEKDPELKENPELKKKIEQQQNIVIDY